MITATDLTEQHSTSAVYLAGDIYRQSTLDGLAAAASEVKQLQRNLAAADASAYSTGRIVTTITDAITTRLLQLGEAQAGPAAGGLRLGRRRFAGAQRADRQERPGQLHDPGRCYDEAAHGAYFKALASFVYDGLDACGYVYCPGEMMARTDDLAPAAASLGRVLPPLDRDAPSRRR